RSEAESRDLLLTLSMRMSGSRIALRASGMTGGGGLHPFDRHSRRSEAESGKPGSAGTGLAAPGFLLSQEWRLWVGLLQRCIFDAPYTIRYARFARSVSAIRRSMCM